MKKNYTYTVKLSEENAKKLAYVSASEGVSVQNMLTLLIRQKVQYFERVKGNISQKELNSVDLSQFDTEENSQLTKEILYFIKSSRKYRQNAGLKLSKMPKN